MPEGCALAGKLLDEQYTLRGSFRDPTPQLTWPERDDRNEPGARPLGRAPGALDRLCVEVSAT
jgi:hypothetical protein